MKSLTASCLAATSHHHNKLRRFSLSLQVPKLLLFLTYGSPSDHKLGGYDGRVCYDEGFYKEHNVDIENMNSGLNDEFCDVLVS